MLSEQASTLIRPTHPVGSAVPAPGLEPELELHEVWEGLLRRRWIIAALTVAGLLCGMLVAITSPKQFSATATVEFAQAGPRTLGLENPSDGATDLSTLELLNTELKTQQTEIEDDNTALAVIDQLHLTASAPYAIPEGLAANDPLARERGLPLERAPYQRDRVIKLFHDHLAVEMVKGTRLISVTYTDTDPERAALIANGVVNASMTQTAARRSTAVAQVSSWLTDQLAVLKQHVEESQRAVETYERDNEKDLAGFALATPNSGSKGAEISTGAASVPVTRLLTLNSDLTNTQVARLAKEAIYRVTESQDADAVLSLGNSTLLTGMGADSSLSPVNGGLNLLQRLREQQVQLSVQAAAAGTKYGAKNPQMLEYQRQREALDTQIKAELARIRDRAAKDLQLAVEAENGLRTRVSTQEGEVSRWTTKADHLMLLQGEAASNRGLYQDLYAKLQESQLATGLNASRVAFVDPARVPTRPSSPKKRRDVALGLAAGLALGLFTALLLELLDSSLYTEYAVTKNLGVRVLGTIPRFPSGKLETPWIQAAPQSRFAEAYRSFRSAAFANETGSTGQVVLFTSARPAEGKATTCLNTAAALAAQGRRVVIVNADTRRSTDHALWPQSSPDLSGATLGDNNVQKNTLVSLPGLPGVPVLLVGSGNANAPELLSSPGFADVIAELRADFDLVLIDSPPSLLYTDAQILAEHADRCIVVVRAGKTPRRDARRTVDLLQRTTAPVTGVLLNAVKTKAPAYRKFGYEN